ncbi:MAG TPA: thymidylate kinase [Tenericutes bacterium]|nr:thymidylate kinase [Mycoplasmatota bacterium]
MKGKLIVIEGTDCSGKETQTNLLVEKLNNIGLRVKRFSYPNYDSPTGKIVGGPYLGKKHICEGWFLEGAANVDPKIAALYFAADRRYNKNIIKQYLNDGVNIILDRYIYSNIAHQGGKIENTDERFAMYKWLEKLEVELLELPHADIKVFLHMPYEQACILKKDRLEQADQHESDERHLRLAEKSFIEVASKFDFKTIECVDNEKIKSIDEINKELYEYVLSKLKKA